MSMDIIFLLEVMLVPMDALLAGMPLKDVVKPGLTGEINGASTLTRLK